MSKPPVKPQLLIDEPPLQVLPTLAVLIGLNEAIALQQLHYWLWNVRRTGASKIGVIDRNGKAWIYNSIAGWQKRNFRFWSEATVKRLFRRLEDTLGLIETRKRFQLDLDEAPARSQEEPPDQTLYYTINYYLYNELIEKGEITNLEFSEKPLGQNDQMARPLGQNDPTHLVNLTPPLGQNDQMLNIESETTREYTENGSGDPRSPSSGSEFWEMITGQLLVQMRSADYAAFVKTLRFEGVRDGVMRLSAESNLQRDWVEQRLGSTINRLLPAVMGQACRAEFVLRRNV